MPCYKFWVVTILLHWSLYAHGQTKISVVYHNTSAIQSLNAEQKNLLFPDTIIVHNNIDVFTALQKQYNKIQEDGWLAFSFDTVFPVNDSVWQSEANIGQKYKWAKLSFDELPLPVLNYAGLKQKYWENQALNPKKYASICATILKYCENNGYPLASLSLKNVREEKEGFYASLHLNQGTIIKIDTIKIYSRVDVARNFLLSYLGIKQGDIFKEQLLQSISNKLHELPFIDEAKPWEFKHSIAGTELILYLKEKKANQLNGLIGLQPNTEATGKFMLTIDALINLKNALGYGEHISATFQNLQQRSPRFHAEAGLSYIAGTPFGIDGIFDLFKRDTFFLRITFDGGLRYLLNSRDYIRLSYISTSNRIITPDLPYVATNKRLPENIDVKTNGAGLGLVMNKTDYALNPKKGWEGNIITNALIREVKPNDAITEYSDASGFAYEKLYDTITGKKYQYKLWGGVCYYFQLYQTIVLKSAYSGGYVNGKQLFMNELYQIGGYKLLRGYDEQSIFSNQYHIGSIELRLLTSRNSYFYIFSDGGFVQTQYNLVNNTFYPISFGGGLALENQGGVFNIAIGVGRQADEGFKLRQTKLHFGYVAYF